MFQDLVVDDKESFRFLLRSYLEFAGYQVITVAGGLEALAALENTGIDLILSDLTLPEMDGLSLLRRVTADSRTFCLY